MPDNEIQATETVQDDSVMTSAATDLADRVCFLEFMATTPEFVGPDILDSLGFVTAENFGTLVHFEVDSECFAWVLVRAMVDEREELADVVLVRRGISRTDVERRICDV